MPTVDFNRNPGEGQLTVEERKMVYNLLIEQKPELGIEIGTWKGGGSTYIISSALQENNKGRLHTFELNPDFYMHATKLYEEGELSYLRERIIFHQGYAAQEMPKFLGDRSCDFLMLDGDDDSSQTLMELAIANRALKTHALIFCHDWYGSGKQHMTKGVLELKEFYELLWDSKPATGMRIYRKKY